MPDDKTSYNAIHDETIHGKTASQNPMHSEKRNVYINGKRTSLSIEAYIWDEIDQLQLVKTSPLMNFAARLMNTVTNALPCHLSFAISAF